MNARHQLTVIDRLTVVLHVLVDQICPRSLGSLIFWPMAEKTLEAQLYSHERITNPAARFPGPSLVLLGISLKFFSREPPMQCRRANIVMRTNVISMPIGKWKTGETEGWTSAFGYVLLTWT